MKVIIILFYVLLALMFGPLLIIWAIKYWWAVVPFCFYGAYWYSSEMKKAVHLAEMEARAARRKDGLARLTGQ